ncbi:putative peptide chain release factor 1, mitochondrial [Podospora conica]|nr:putative peptide chain release factor 1, mitochondrial [Schizothecium conicum]
MITTAPWVCRSCAWSLRRASISQFIRRASTVATEGGLPPALLARARKVAAEHDQLSAQLEASFDPKAARRAGELSRVATALREFEKTKASLAELEGLLKSDDAELRDLARDDIESTTSELAEVGRQLSVALTPKHPFAHMPCLLEVRPGPGGLEGRLFADAIFTMYKTYCENMGYRTRVVKYEISETEGIGRSGGEMPLQEAILEVQDEGAYGLFRGEAGVHRVQRIPVTEKTGRVHTSVAVVWVLPSFPADGAGSEAESDWENPESDFYIDPVEVRTETMKARGPGGQHVNKTESAIRLTHIPTGTTVSMQDSRSQATNRKWAWMLLRSRIAQQRREVREEHARSIRQGLILNNSRGDKIRTYNYQQDRCTDHRSGQDFHNLPNVLQGGEVLGKVIKSAESWLVERDIQELLADEEEEAAPSGNKKKGGK